MLVDDAVSRDEGLVLDHHVTAEQRARGDDHLAPEPAVVADVRLRHQEVVVADLGPGLGLRGAMYLGVLAEHVAIADPESGQRSRIAEVLRLVAEHRSGVHDVVGAELGASGEVRAGHDPGPRSDAHRAVDDDVGADLRRRVDLRHAVDEGRRVDGHALVPVVLRTVFARSRRLGRDGFARDAVALLGPRRQIQDTAALGAEGAVPVALPVDLAAARRTAHSAHGAESSRSPVPPPHPLNAPRPRVTVPAHGTRCTRRSPRPQLRGAARR